MEVHGLKVLFTKGDKFGLALLDCVAYTRNTVTLYVCDMQTTQGQGRIFILLHSHPLAQSVYLKSINDIGLLNQYRKALVHFYILRDNIHIDH